MVMIWLVGYLMLMSYFYLLRFYTLKRADYIGIPFTTGISSEFWISVFLLLCHHLRIQDSCVLTIS